MRRLLVDDVDPSTYALFLIQDDPDPHCLVGEAQLVVGNVAVFLRRETLLRAAGQVECSKVVQGASPLFWAALGGHGISRLQLLAFASKKGFSRARLS
jgi:hypothetical protein